MRTALLCTLLALPCLASAAEDCKFQAPRDLALDLAGVRSVVLSLGPHTLHATAATGGKATIDGRACASAQDLLAPLVLTQRRDGDRLIIAADDAEPSLDWNLFGDSRYAYLDLRLQLPAGIPLELAVGSGEAHVAGIERLTANVGSGDLAATRIANALTARVGSGDLKASEVGMVDLQSLGSGDVDVTGVRGDAQVGSVGSGNVSLRRVQAGLTVGSIGSGDLEAHEVGGSVDVGSIGSGDARIKNVGGGLTVRSIASGSVGHSGIKGAVSVPSDD